MVNLRVAGSIPAPNDLPRRFVTQGRKPETETVPCGVLVEFKTSNDTNVPQRCKHREFVGAYSRNYFVGPTEVGTVLQKWYRLKALTLSSRSQRQGQFQIFHVIANASAVILHNTARVALFDTMTKCIVAFQPECGGLDRITVLMIEPFYQS